MIGCRTQWLQVPRCVLQNFYQPMETCKSDARSGTDKVQKVIRSYLGPYRCNHLIIFACMLHPALLVLYWDYDGWKGRGAASLQHLADKKRVSRAFAKSELQMNQQEVSRLNNAECRNGDTRCWINKSPKRFSQVSGLRSWRFDASTDWDKK